MIHCGQTRQLSYSLFPDYDNPTITWASDNPSVISIDNGIISAHSVGSATITATVDSISDSVTVISYIPAESFELGSSEEWVVAEGTVQLQVAAIRPDAAEAILTWSSSNTSSATVDSTGFVTTKKKLGDVTIAAVGENGYRQECLLHLCYPVSAIEFKDVETTITPYVDYQSIANVTMNTQHCENHLVEFTSGNPKVATVDVHGVVHGITAGTTTITATAASGVTASMTVNVREPYTLYLPSGLTEIDNEAFMGTACEAVIIPESCTTIGEYAFAGCTNLMYVKIPSSVKTYPNNVFEGCSESLVIDWDQE